ncbi:dTDP-4-dehydrorhamnose reductase [Vibrio sp. F13]|uniref:dTDP-4-dehydrorhamnose reductase n=1 Tax=Vibrio sp. F13 TaxID=2070777 RepID=UPI0010BD1D67|nr:dTDP-4-dehydrorhamnose reductase [Vibrio sp. F13]TKF69488.1 dTDP-4-dehydrorhamnose reductase [Vibrio sp. F13]
MKILISGCNGQLGLSLTKQLVDYKDISVVALDRNEFDVTNRDLVFKEVFNYKPDVIINTAAYTNVDKAEEEKSKAYLVNRDGPKNLADISQEQGITLIHVSTDYVFDGDKKEAYIESDVANPQGIYGLSKLDGENEILKSCDKSIIVRTAWVFGEYGSNFFKTMLKLSEKKESISVVDDQIGGPTYSGDLAKALIQIAIKSVEHESDVKYGIYHFSGFPYVSWYDFSKEIFLELRNKSEKCLTSTILPISSVDFGAIANRPKSSKLGMKKINEEFGVEPSDWKFALKNIKN